MRRGKDQKPLIHRTAFHVGPSCARIGCAMSLPWLERWAPLTNWSLARNPKPAPNRMAFVYVPNGVNMADWTPSTEGADFELPHLQPLKTCAMTSWSDRPGRRQGPRARRRAGDHARAMAAFLTGASAPQNRWRDSARHLRRSGRRAGWPIRRAWRRWRSAASTARWPAMRLRI